MAIPLGIGTLPQPLLSALLRYAVEGIASSLRRLAPRNDNPEGRANTGARPYKERRGLLPRDDSRGHFGERGTLSMDLVRAQVLTS